MNLQPPINDSLTNFDFSGSTAPDGMNFQNRASQSGRFNEQDRRASTMRMRQSASFREKIYANPDMEVIEEEGTELHTNQLVQTFNTGRT